MIDRIAPRFSRYEPLRHAAGLMLGMISGLDRKNCWTIAEHRGDGSPGWVAAPAVTGAMGRRSVRDDLRDYVVDAFGDPGAVLVVDETGDVKKGIDTVGVQRQYTGTAGRIENAQVAGVSDLCRAAWTCPDRPPACICPAAGAEDAERCDRAGIPAANGISRPNPRWHEG